MTENRKCTRCKKEKPDNQFYNQIRCQDCKNYYDNYYKTHKKQEIARAQKSNRNKSREEHNIYKKTYHRLHPLVVMFRNARSRAKKKNLPFDLNIEDLTIPDVCPILGIPLKVNDKHCGQDSPSIDRLIPELGYIKNNVTIISHRANTIKNNGSVEDLEKVLNWLKERLIINADSNGI